MKKFILALIFVFLIPTFVFASSVNNTTDIVGAIAIEAFVSIHMSVFVINPLSKKISKDNSKKIFWILFVIRAVFLLLFDFFVNPYIAVGIDFIVLFVLLMIVMPIIYSKINKSSSYDAPLQENVVNAEIRCKNCGNIVQKSYKFCGNCGAALGVQNVAEDVIKNVVHFEDYDQIYSGNETQTLELFIKREMEKISIKDDSKYIPLESLKRKKILNIIFSILLFVFVSLIFFHFPIYTYVIGMIILIIFFFATRKFSLLKFLAKEVKSRPTEKISNIVMNVSNTLVPNTSNRLKIIGVLIAVLLPMIIFESPRIMYEKQDDGYAVRFYTIGVRNFRTATIPESHNGEKVVELRGNCFSNIPFLQSVTLPDTLVSIRGQAFKNDINLESVNMPKDLEYLGGSAFYNCKKIKNIEFSDKLTEIKGNTFEGCTSLRSVKIPDSVERIGGHAFYGCRKLNEVDISSNSNLKEIGSSAFRLCSSLQEITIPQTTSVNSRAFKESPTAVKRYSSNDSKAYSESEFKYCSFNYLKLNEKCSLVMFHKDSVSYTLNPTITLLSAAESSNGNEFNLIYEDENGKVNITFTKEKKNIKINDNLVLVVSRDYVFEDYNNVFCLNVYYN